MSRTLFFAALVLLFLPLAAAAAVRNVSPGDAKAMLELRPQVFILDVRTPGEYRESRLAGARLIPIDEIARRRQEIPADRPVLVYCAVGSRSADVARYLDGQGFAEVYNLFGGIWAWRLRGFPVLAGGP